MLLFKENHQPTPQLCQVSHKGQYLDLCCFYHYISSISQLPLSNGAQMTLYADDLLLIKPIKVANDYILLQQDTTTITNHIEELHLTLNASKCKIIWGQEKDSLFSLLKKYPSVVAKLNEFRATATWES